MLNSQLIDAGPPLSNVDDALVNITNSHNPANIMSNNGHNPSSLNTHVLDQPRNNIEAAKSYIHHVGGMRKRNHKNKISRKYKLTNHKHRKFSTRRSKKHHPKKHHAKKHCTRTRRFKRTQLRHKKRHHKTRRGGAMGPLIPGATPIYPAGYNQYQNNLPQNISYSLGGKISPGMSALANPVPISQVTNNTVDNLNHYSKNNSGIGNTGMGFPSRGWW